MSMKQKDAVRIALLAAAEQGLEGDAATTFAVEQVKAGLMTGEIGHSKGFTDEAKAKSYARSLIANWRKKDKELTGGVPYVPATRRGPQVKDETLKKLLAAKKSLEANKQDPALIAQVEAKIQERRDVLAAEKASSKVQSLDETMATLESLGVISA
jgi:hypothetical protein